MADGAERPIVTTDPAPLPSEGVISEPQAIANSGASPSHSRDIPSRPRAGPSRPKKFRPYITSKDWESEENLVQQGPRFKRISRVNALDPDLDGKIRGFEDNGVPLVIEGWHEHPEWPGQDLFSVEYFAKQSPTTVGVRNIHDWCDSEIALDQFVQKSRNASNFVKKDETERLYGKDAECPVPWMQWLEKVLPRRTLQYGDHDLLKHLPKGPHGEPAVETLMCYLGIGDTFTPCHKDLCGSTGQNLMCYTEDGGSSFWFMTKSSDAPLISQYFHDLSEELDLETHVITVKQLAAAPFDVYITEQKLGDMVLVPPRSGHQVVNSGGITIKTSWSRMTLAGLTAALYHELPIYRRVCRPEIYKVKLIVYHSLLARCRVLETVQPSERDSAKTHDAASELDSLLSLFDDILAEEFCDEARSMRCLNSSSTTSEHIVCDVCGADVFQSLFECQACKQSADNSGYITCSSCYVEGRSCRCRTMEPVQCNPFDMLLDQRNQASKLLLEQQVTVDRPIVLNWQDLKSITSTSESCFPLFQAGCYLREQRVIQNGTDVTREIMRQCSHGRPGHATSRVSAASCRHCHRYRCFEHYLTGCYVHALDALLVQRRGDNDEDWHERHTGGKKKFADASALLLQAAQAGTRPPCQYFLASTARNFTACNPINTEYFHSGWYDQETRVDTNPVKAGITRPVIRPKLGEAKRKQSAMRSPSTSEESDGSDSDSVDDEDDDPSYGSAARTRRTAKTESRSQRVPSSARKPRRSFEGRSNGGITRQHGGDELFKEDDELPLPSAAPPHLSRKRRRSCAQHDESDSPPESKVRKSESTLTSKSNAQHSRPITFTANSKKSSLAGLKFKKHKPSTILQQSYSTGSHHASPSAKHQDLFVPDPQIVKQEEPLVSVPQPRSASVPRSTSSNSGNSVTSSLQPQVNSSTSPPPADGVDNHRDHVHGSRTIEQVEATFGAELRRQDEAIRDLRSQVAALTDLLNERRESNATEVQRRLATEMVNQQLKERIQTQDETNLAFGSSIDRLATELDSLRQEFRQERDATQQRYREPTDSVDIVQTWPWQMNDHAQRWGGESRRDDRYRSPQGPQAPAFQGPLRGEPPRRRGSYNRSYPGPSRPGYYVNQDSRW